MSSLHDWFQTPPGQRLLHWETAHFDTTAADIFGYNALQLGLPELDTLSASRMPHRWLGLSSVPVNACGATMPRLALAADPTALPFAEASLDLIALPHTLELSDDPRASLREVQRVLVPEGKALITGLNPVSLWGLRHRLGASCLPDAREFIHHWRLRDWLRLLGFELDSITHGCWLPATHSQRAQARLPWLERLGARACPPLGAVYFIMATKRVRGARLISPGWSRPATALGVRKPVGATQTITDTRHP